MPDWLSEHIGEIALLIYIVYPLLKRWWDRRKERRDRLAAAVLARPASAPMASGMSGAIIVSGTA